MTPHDSARERRVLVVDDIEANRVALEMELAEAGFTVETAASGTAALSRLKATRFDALVTDIWMADGDGIALLRDLRGGDGMVIYAVTGGGPGMSIASAHALARVWEAQRIYLKPFDVRGLVADLRADLGLS